jgi:hypothetical protein
MKKFLAILSLAAFMSSSMASPLVSSFNYETVSVSKLDKDKDKDKDKKKKKKEKSCSADEKKSCSEAAGANNGAATTAPKSCCSKDASKSCSKDQKQVAPSK